LNKLLANTSTTTAANATDLLSRAMVYKMILASMQVYELERAKEDYYYDTNWKHELQALL
jgi:hypothetical protein